MALRLVEAKRVVEAAIAKAEELKVNISVAVCDREGRLIALLKMDHASAMAGHESIGKAIVSAGWGLPSGEPVGPSIHLTTGIVMGEGAPAIRSRGGLPIIRAGIVEGACGVSGADNRDQDEDCARAGLAAL